MVWQTSMWKTGGSTRSITMATLPRTRSSSGSGRYVSVCLGVCTANNNFNTVYIYSISISFPTVPVYIPVFMFMYIPEYMHHVIRYVSLCCTCIVMYLTVLVLSSGWFIFPLLGNLATHTFCYSRLSHVHVQ